MEEPIFNPPFISVEYLFNKIYLFFKAIPEFVKRLSEAGDFSAYIEYLHIALSLLSILLITGIIYSVIRIYEIRKAEDEKYNFADAHVPSVDMQKNKRWEQVEKYMDSENPSEWKLAVLEADSILEEMVAKMGYPGDSLGERLQAVEKSDFNSIQNAWEAHKVRNQIAHEGANFELTKREAKRAVGLYETVFREFEYI